MIKFRNSALAITVATSLCSGALMAEPMVYDLYLSGGDTVYKGSFSIDKTKTTRPDGGGGAIVPISDFDSFEISIMGFQYSLKNVFEPHLASLNFSGFEPWQFKSGNPSGMLVCSTVCDTEFVLPVLQFINNEGQQGWGVYNYDSNDAVTLVTGGRYSFYPPTVVPAPVPVPAPLALVGLGLVSLGWLRRRKVAKVAKAA